MSRTMATFAVVALVPASAFAQSSQLLTGDTRYACEAIICLSSGQPPHECEPALRRYFSINFRRLSDTIRARRSFLDQCPMATSSSPSGRPLPDHAVETCSPERLNASPSMRTDDDKVSNVMPSYCLAYAQPGRYTSSITLPLYVGEPARGGFWVEPEGYSWALFNYNGNGGTGPGGSSSGGSSCPWGGFGQGGAACRPGDSTDEPTAPGNPSSPGFVTGAPAGAP